MAKKETLLVVEDDQGIQSQLKWSFDDYEVVIAGSREEAIGLLRRHEPKVVTLDMGLPPDPGGTSEGLALCNKFWNCHQKPKWLWSLAMTIENLQ